MHTISFRRLGGSVVVAIPPVVMEMMELVPGMKVKMALESGRLMIGPDNRKHYTLEELLAQQEYLRPLLDADKSWPSGAPCGRELV